MADNVEVTAGAGTTVHADEYTHSTLGSGKTQLVKLVDGTLDAEAAIAADVGVKANALRVAPANDITDATYIGDIKFGESLPAGTNAIGKLAANSGVDIGDVDVTSIVPGVAATNLGKAEDAEHASGDVGVAAMTVRANTATALSGADNDYQPLITDTNGRLHVLDANSANMLTALQIIDDWDDANYCNVNLNIAGTDVSANSGTLDATTQRVTIATDDEVNNLLGTIDADTSTLAGAVSGTEMQCDLVATNRANAVEAVTDWTAVAQNAVGESGTVDCSGHDATSLNIQAFLDSTTAHTGTKFQIQVSYNTSGDEDWSDYREFVALIGTANSEAITDNPLSAGSTTITMANTGGNYETAPMGRWLAIEDGTLVNSELVCNSGYTTDTNITIIDGTTNEHAQNTVMYDIAASKTVILDSTVNRVRVIINNTYDTNGSTLNYKVRATKLTR